MEERRGSYRVLLGKTEGNKPFVRPRHRWYVNMKLDMQEVVLVGGGWTGLIWLRVGTGDGSCARGSNPSSPIKCMQFLEWLTIGWLLQKHCAPWSV